jgi:imidazolonepropionase-like amidohydrolase
MTFTPRLFATFCLICLSPFASAAPIAFVDVTIVSVDDGKLLPGQTVLIRDDRVVAIGPPATTAVPADAQRIEGQGRYLSPGLADMHVHFSRAPTPGKEIEWGSLDHREKNERYAL